MSKIKIKSQSIVLFHYMMIPVQVIFGCFGCSEEVLANFANNIYALHVHHLDTCFTRKHKHIKVPGKNVHIHLGYNKRFIHKHFATRLCNLK